jgi:hypothetical protein
MSDEYRTFYDFSKTIAKKRGGLYSNRQLVNTGLLIDLHAKCYVPLFIRHTGEIKRKDPESKNACKLHWA